MKIKLRKNLVTQRITKRKPPNERKSSKLDDFNHIWHKVIKVPDTVTMQ